LLQFVAQASEDGVGLRVPQAQAIFNDSVDLDFDEHNDLLAVALGIALSGKGIPKPSPVIFGHLTVYGPELARGL
jgi:hypothetical protein